MQFTPWSARNATALWARFGVSTIKAVAGKGGIPSRIFPQKNRRGPDSFTGLNLVLRQTRSRDAASGIANCGYAICQVELQRQHLDIDVADMRMHIDESRQDPLAARINNSGIFWNLDVAGGPDFCDSAFAHKHRDVFSLFAAADVDQSATDNRNRTLLHRT